MSIYNITELEKLSIISEAKNAFQNNLISKDEFEAIAVEYKSKLYIPQLAIKIGLFLSVVILSSVVFGLFVLMFLDSFNGFGFISIFLFFITLIITYYLSTKKMHFGSGADNAFLYCSITFFIIWIGSTFNSSSGVGFSLVLFIISAAAAIVFLDRFLSVVSLIALLSSFYFALHNSVSVDILMFCLMTISFLISLIANYYKGKVGYWNRGLLKTLLYSSLTTAFLATNSLFVLNIIEDSFLFRTIFDIIMVMLPLIYILIGIKFKNKIFLQCGGTFFLASVYCVVFMYSGSHFFEFLCVYAAAIILISWRLSRYLIKERRGFIFIDKNEFSNIEAVGAINTAIPPTEGFKFGGGGFGGGGASGEF